MPDAVDSLGDCVQLYNGPIRSDSSLILVRSRLAAIARRLGFVEAQREDMALVAAEMGSNLVKHAAGRGMIQIWQQPGGALDLVAIDFGPGIDNPRLAQADGYSTAHTLGKGLGSIERLSDRYAIYSVRESYASREKWHGTVVWARFQRRSTRPAEPCRFEVGLYSQAFSNGRYNGDRILLRQAETSLRWLHIDGLGHGERAQATTGVLDGAIALPGMPLDALGELDRLLRGTRGAVAIAGQVDLIHDQVQFAGVGDMQARVLLQEQMQSFAFAPGILGREHKTPQLQRLSFAGRVLALTASDGIRRSWDAGYFPGLFNQPPQLIAYALGNIMGRVSDDQSLCVIAIR